MDWPFNATAVERFWAKVIKSEGCWLWQGCPGEDGYGQFRSGGKGSPTLRAHRVAWAFWHGKMPPADRLVCHHCDQPLCVRPSHLFVGTPADNSADMRSKGRQMRGENHPRYACGSFPEVRPEQRARGERNAASRLTEEMVREIRRLSAKGARQVDLAERFGIAQPNISKVIRRETWAHV